MPDRGVSLVSSVPCKKGRNGPVWGQAVWKRARDWGVRADSAL